MFALRVVPVAIWLCLGTWVLRLMTLTVLEPEKWVPSLGWVPQRTIECSGFGRSPHLPNVPIQVAMVVTT